MDRKESLRKILIIDDDDDCRKLLMNWLASQFQDIEVVEYDPQSQGVPGKNFNWSAFDVLLLDYDLRLDGVTGLDILQDNYDNLLFPTTIMLTGAGNQEIEVRALRYGVADYMRKDQIKKKTLKVIIDSAFAQQSSKRQRFYTLNDAMQVAQTESKKIIEAYKMQYEQEREQEIKYLKADMQKILQDLEKNQAMLATLEEDQTKSEVEKSRLLAETHELNDPQLTVTEEVDIKTKLDTTLEELLQVNTSIKNVKQDINNAKAAMEKTKWRQDKGTTEQQDVENELTIVLDDTKQSSDVKDDMRQRLEAYINHDTKKIDLEDENYKLFDEVTTQLDTEDN